MTAVSREFIGVASPALGRAGAGGHPLQGIYYRPEGRRPTTAMIATHYNVDFTEHYIANRMAARGVGFLGWNTRFRGAESFFQLDHALVEIGVGVQWLRDHGVDRVVLCGNSGGGSLMAAYYSQSVEPNLRPAYGRSAVYEPALSLPKADLVVFLAAHPGRPEWITMTMDPSLTDEFDPVSVDPELDMYNPEHGPPYGEEFIARYRAAQVERNRRITAWCKEEITRLREHGGSDRLFAMTRTWADLRYVDPAIDPSDRPSPLCYFGEPRHANYGVFGVGTVSTLRTWLNMFSLDDSDCTVDRHLERIDVPSLVIEAAGDTGVFPSDARRLHEGTSTRDKELVTIPGDHYFVEPADARDRVADLMADWAFAHQ